MIYTIIILFIFLAVQNIDTNMKLNRIIRLIHQIKSRQNPTVNLDNIVKILNQENE